jgi:hypothetical protein
MAVSYQVYGINSGYIVSKAVKKAISLPADLAAEAEAIARDENKSLSAVVQDALRGLKQLFNPPHPGEILADTVLREDGGISVLRLPKARYDAHCDLSDHSWQGPSGLRRRRHFGQNLACNAGCL